MPLSADPRIDAPRPTSITHADLDSRLMRYFLAVVREGSIRRAAETLNVAASAVSRQISDLELRLGLPLLERLPRGVIPTEAGTAIAEHARQQMEDGDRLLDYLKQLHGLRQGAVRIRCGEGFVGDLLENGVQPFSEVYPNIRLQLLLGVTPDILDAVAESSADVGLAYNPPSHAGVRSAAISRQPLCLLVAPGHPYRDHASIDLRGLVSEPLALLTMHHGIRQLIGRVEADHGIHLVPNLESSSIDVVRRYAISGRGVTLLPRFAAVAEIAEGRLCAVPLSDPLLAEASAHLLVRSQRRLPGAVEQLVAFLTTRMQAFTLQGGADPLPAAST